MEKPPEEIRSEIDDVRDDLGETLEAIGDRVAPKKVVARAKSDAADKIRGVKVRFSPRRLTQRGTEVARRGLRSAVGSDNSSAATVPVVARPARGPQRGAIAAPKSQGKAVAKKATKAASSVTDTLGDAPDAVRQKAEGNPVAAGLLAFAGGFFAAALLPATDRERQLTEKAKEHLQPLAKEATEVGKNIAGELQSTAQAGLESVKDTATGGVEEVKGQAQSSVGHVKGEASDATQTVAERTKAATTTMKKQAKGAAGAVKGQAKKAPPAPRRAPMTAPAPKRPPVAARPPRTVVRPEAATPRRRP